MKKFKNVIALSIVTVLLAGSSVMAAKKSTDTVWKEAPVKYYDASKLYTNDYYDGYSFTIKKLCKKGKTTDYDKYKKLNMEITVTNTNKMRLIDSQTNKVNWKFAYECVKGKTYSYLIVDKNGNFETYKTGLNSRIKSTQNKAMNTQINHCID